VAYKPQILKISMQTVCAG